MTFQWQTREQAAATLEVDPATLQQWIDQGRAPSRTTDGRVEVLIEFPDEGDADSHDAAEAEVVTEHASGPAVNANAGALELVSRRELQMAGGIAAAWQRLAEQSDHELVRARRLSTVAWCVVALLTLASGGGIWWATHATLTARNEADLTRQDLTHLTTTAEERARQIEQLSARIAAVQEQFTRAQAELAATTERAAAAAKQLEQAGGLHEQTLTVMKQSAEQQRQRLSELQATLAAQRQQNDALARELQSVREQLSSATAAEQEQKSQLSSADGEAGEGSPR